MATAAQMKALLATACPWCGAGPGQRCIVRIGKATLRPSTLDGESHDARWRAAKLGPAPVLTAEVTERGLAASAAPERPW